MLIADSTNRCKPKGTTISTAESKFHNCMITVRLLYQPQCPQGFVHSEHLFSSKCRSQFTSNIGTVTKTDGVDTFRYAMPEIPGMHIDKEKCTWIGNKRTSISAPTNAAGPSCAYRRTMEITMRKGADHRLWSCWHTCCKGTNLN